MAHAPYPDAAQATECLMDGIAIVRGGWEQVVAQRSELGKHAWTVGGFGLKVSLGDPDGPFAMEADAETNLSEHLNEFATAFQSCCADRISADVLAEVKSVNEGFAAGRIDWAKWAKFFIEVVLPIIIAA